MKNVSELYTLKERPIKVLQFGEGNFLRAFVDYAIDVANEELGFDGNVAIVIPRSKKPARLLSRTTFTLYAYVVKRMLSLMRKTE